MKIVPDEPTEEMIEAVYQQHMRWGYRELTLGEVYKSMIEAAPGPCAGCVEKEESPFLCEACVRSRIICDFYTTKAK